MQDKDESQLNINTLDDMDDDIISDLGIYNSQLDDIADDYKKGYKLYNFRRPDKFSKDNLKALRDIHREFSKAISLILSGYLRMRVEIEIVSVDQLTYEEFVRSMPSPISVGVFEFEPLTGQILLGISFEVLSALVDRMLGGVGVAETKHRELTDIEEALSRKIIEKTVKTLETSWANVHSVEGKIVGVDNSFTTIQVATSGEIVALITFEVQIAGQHFGLLSLCFPYPVLEGVLSQLTTQHFFQSKGLMSTDEEKAKMIQKLNPSFLNIAVQFGTAEITAKELLELRVGDVIKLDNKINEEVIVKINDEKKFFARPGTLKNSVCVRITDRYNALKQVLRSYI